MLRLALALSLLVATSALAVEGIWQPRQLPALEAQMRQAGIAVDPKQVAELTRYPMNAVVSLGGYCTASFVSPMGLILTNHHCAFGSIQFNSSSERNLLQDGFLAATFGEELKAEPALRVYVTESIADVSERLRAVLKAKMDGRARFDAVDRAKKALVRACESDADYRCEVQVFHGGAQYFLVRQLQLRDLRLVYAPARAIGNFGGDVDNWSWPRHTGDFAFYRAYVGPDGKPADFSESNVPYQPAAHLKPQPAGLQEGDFAMLAGYPGRTNRYRLAEEVADAISWQYPSLIARHRKLLELVDEQSRSRAELVIKYAGYVASMNNGLKSFQANLDGLGRIEAVGRKRGEEAVILKWANAHGHQAGAAAFKALTTQLAEQRSHRDRDQLLQLLNGSVMFASVRDLHRLALERQKSPMEREYGYQPRDESRIEARLAQVDRRHDPAVDRALLSYLLGELIALPEQQRIAELDRWVAGGDGAATP
ncbi:MAG TPA: S46 family peptidase, partial [Xanthomonadales bacterium]|nr:S46 family peptidase [Xanthomonadales bacterium]